MFRPRVWSQASARVASSLRQSLKSRAQHTAPWKTPSKNGLPERLLIYDVGPGASAMMGYVKVFSLVPILLAVGTCVSDGPSKFAERKHIFISIPLALVPPVAVYYFSKGLIATITIVLPPKARMSTTALQSWLKQGIPGPTQFRLQTLNAIGLPKSHLVEFATLRKSPKSKQGKSVLLARTEKGEGVFSLHDDPANERRWQNKVPVMGVWPEVKTQIRQT